MKHPKVKIKNPAKTFIYIKNILNWSRHNPFVKKHFADTNYKELAEKMGEITEDFIPLWNKYHDFVLKNISNISGFQWSSEEPYIYVYPTPVFNSFSHPLFLRICSVKESKVHPRSFGLTLGFLIHELCHYNIKGLPVKRKVNETIINFVTISILEKINNEYKEEYIKFHKNADAEINLSLIPKKIKNNTTTIKEHYNK